MSTTAKATPTLNGSTSGFDPTTQDEITLALIQNGGLARVQAAFKQRLDEAGWSQELREYVTRLFRSGQATTYDDAMAMVLARIGGEGEEGAGDLSVPREAQEGGAEAVRRELAGVVKGAKK